MNLILWLGSWLLPVLRIPKPATGFRERSSAFDLKAVLDDFVRFIDRQNRAAEASVTEVKGRVGSGLEKLCTLLCIISRNNIP